jgi:hypothetical protein
MPYKSMAQERWAHTPAGTKALGGAAGVAEWDSASKGMKLPDKLNARQAATIVARRRRKKKANP